jgi:ankyrin repeat protein
LEFLRCLVKDLGADVNKATDQGFTPLIAAVQLENLAHISCLINELGADVNQGDEDGRSALFMAASNGKLDVVRCLLKLRADANQTNDDGATPLMMASAEKHEEVVVWLVKAGADTQATTAVYSNGESVTAADASKRFGASASQTAYLEAKTHCSNTSCSSAGLKKCPACKQARYCGEPCQLAHWKAHKADCKRWSAELSAGKGEGKGKGK